MRLRRVTLKGTLYKVLVKKSIPISVNESYFQNPFCKTRDIRAIRLPIFIIEAFLNADTVANTGPSFITILVPF